MIHVGQPVEVRPAADPARPGAMILVHGRGATPHSILEVGAAIGGRHLARYAPTASGHSWYPHSFLAPIEANQPGLDSALSVLEEIVREREAEGVSPETLILVGFSQGACLTLEYAARHPRRYGAVIGFSGGLIGPPGTPREYAGRLEGTPVFVGCSDVDSHVPRERVEETGEVMAAMGANVDVRIYPGMGHTINKDEIVAASALVEAATGADR